MTIEIENVSPVPSEDEAAAIVAFLERAWPVQTAEGGRDRSTPAWRFSGRWWARPVPARRDRPWF